jgi:RNA polymerase sigma-70 factor (ECF subfamily)
MVASRHPASKAESQTEGERRLVEAAQADPSKFDALYEQNFERVYFFIVCRVHDRAAAEDITSEVFHKALAKLPTYEWRGTPFTAWLYRVASNAISDHFKRANRDQQSGEDAFDPPAPAAIAPDEMEDVERRALLFRLVEKLPEAQRRVIRERFIEDRSIKEIARRLNKTEGAIKQLQFRAVQTLREQMGGHHG